jgi:phosphoribosylformimino-5-aminoimidazole carboxamide ribotide isomerase
VNLYPAVDILGGSAVRLTRGDFHTPKIYDADPLAAASAWVSGGASFLHVVDLDGARRGEPVNLDHLRRIAAELEVRVQYGGGLRSPEAVAQALAAGAERVILGTSAFGEPALLQKVLEAHGPDRVLVSVDVRGGRVATAGWTEQGALDALGALERLQRDGVERFVYTDVDRDGLLEGPDLQALQRLARAVTGQLTYSGGIGSLSDLQALAGMGEGSLEGVIVGKALYEQRFTVAQALATLSA